MSRDVFLRYFDGFFGGTIFGHVIKNTHKMGQNTRKYRHVTSNKGHVMLISDPSNSPGVRRSSGLTPYSGDFLLYQPKLLRTPPHFFRSSGVAPRGAGRQLGSISPLRTQLRAEQISDSGGTPGIQLRTELREHP